VSGDLVRAIEWAIEAHGTQRRKCTTIPYYAHLLGVASLVLEDGGDEQEAVAAVLHDLVEDTDATVEDVRGRFDDRVARIVDACTDAYERPKPPWQPRKDAYIARLRTAAPDELRVAMADKLYNARATLLDFRDHGPALWCRFGGDQLWYYRAVADVFLEVAPGRMAAELDRTVTELERLAAAS
jgi:(p)ppGpp synthase/HD superfamily hydrolase